MKTPMEKYQNDPKYKTLVDVLFAMIVRAEFTPSEVREAAVLACIKHERIKPRSYILHADGSIEPYDSKQKGEG